MNVLKLTLILLLLIFSNYLSAKESKSQTVKPRNYYGVRKSAEKMLKQAHRNCAKHVKWLLFRVKMQK